MNERIEILLKKMIQEYDLTNANLNNNFGPGGLIKKDLIKIMDTLPTKVNKIISHYLAGYQEGPTGQTTGPQTTGQFVELADYLKKNEEQDEHTCRCNIEGPMWKVADRAKIVRSINNLCDALNDLKTIIWGLDND